MRKLYVIVIVSIILFALLIGGYFFFSGGDAGPSRLNNSHFAVSSLSSQPFFAGESVIVNATVINDEPVQEIAVPTTTELTITPNPDDTKGIPTVVAVPTTIVQTIIATGSHPVTARLSGDQGVDIVRAVNVTLASDESRELSFDFGLVPAGSYIVSVTAPSYNDSRMSRAVRVYPSPVFGDWTEIGEAAFLIVNLQHDSVDVIVRNSGEHTIVFSNSQYTIFTNLSEYDGIVLQGLEQTMVTPGKTVTIHAKIPISGIYYLDYFAIKAPGRAVLVKIPVKALISPVT